ncbi:MAG: outer membrane lipoprotein-sorting protein [Spirochaetota bacterium]|nr:outer membrane lipoprotein-sorting protein [Spirochaetota bacterium]
MKSKVVLSFIMILYTCNSLFAITGREIMEKTDALPEPKSMITRAVMNIHKGKSLRVKEFEMMGKKIKGNDRMLASFIKPTRIKFLTHSHKGRDDDQWLRLTSGKIKRIASTDKDKPFVNSHFYYEDMSSMEIDNFDFKYIGDKKVLKEDCFMVEAVKKKQAGEKVYDKQVVYVRKSDYFIARVDFYKKGKFHKYLENYDIKVIKGIITPLRIVMYRADGKGKTEIAMKKIKYNIKIRNSKFAKEALR